MVKLIYCLRRQPYLSRDEFQRVFVAATTGQ